MRCDPAPAEREKKVIGDLMLADFRCAVTVTEYYREQFLKPALDKIAEGAKVSIQRAACLSEIVNQIVWRTMFVCLRKAKNRSTSAAHTPTFFAIVAWRAWRVKRGDNCPHRLLGKFGWSQMAA